jgi:TRAP-type C4-dicarboxylate transport system permease small subunit
MRKLITFASLLVIPLAVLLFAQWPLRDWLQNYSRQANDAAQICFALYAAVAITAASRAGSHLTLSSHDKPGTRGAKSWRAWALLVCLVPWALFLLWTSAPQMWASVRQLESFSEGLTPGYFFLRIALVLLALLVLLEAARAALLGLRRRKHRAPAK